MLPDYLRDVVGKGGGGGEGGGEGSLSCALEPTPVSTVSGKKLTLLLPSTSRTSEAGQKLPTKDQLYPPY